MNIMVHFYCLNAVFGTNCYIKMCTKDKRTMKATEICHNFSLEVNCTNDMCTQGQYLYCECAALCRQNACLLSWFYLGAKASAKQVNYMPHSDASLRFSVVALP